MGVVYEALDRERDTRVALKTLRHLNAEGVFRFKNEFRALQDVQHPNLVSLDELIEEEGRWFLTMELIEGTDFLAYVTRAGGRGVDAAFQPTDRMPTALVPSSGSAPGPQQLSGPIFTSGAADITWDGTNQPRYDEERLRAALGQLARGLSALHGAGKLHRDIKPPNVLVSRAGRVVLLDFGLVANLEEHHSRSSPNQVVGTSAYMAPEQAASKPLGPPADWYAVGVVLYEALTGRLPFNGPPLEILMNKQRFEPAPPRALVPSVPRDLDALCVELLRFEPGARPSAREVLRRLNVEEAFDASGAARVSSSSSQGQHVPFVGREEELGTLRRAFADVRKGAGITVFIEGQSGVGKSALVRHFTRGLLIDTPSAVVLSGRCYERESVPYKAFDGVVDSLSHYMMEIGRLKAAAITPQKAALLAQAFPVLRRVEPIATAPVPQHEVLDPQELRTRVFAGMRELLLRLADREPVVVIIDDLQWADADSLALLRELTRPPEPPLLLLIATVREGSAEAMGGGLLGEVRLLGLNPLPARHAHALATELIGRIAPTSAIDAEAIVSESGGHPLFIDELVRHGSLAVRESTEPLRLEDALWARISRLEPAVQQVLTLAVVAGAPIEQAALARAEGVDPLELSKRVAVLRVANLVKSSGARARDAIEPFHDWVRSACLSHLPAAAKRACHRRLAVALESLDRADPEALLMHWEGAGELAKAAKYAAIAAARASDAFAFDRAALLYGTAIDLLPEGAPERRGLEEKRGDALANGGRGAEAAQAYMRSVPGSNAAAALDLQRRAAEQRLRSGHIDEGLDTLRTVLGAVGMELPRTPQSALTTLLWRRSLIWLRGLGFTERDASQLPQSELTRIDICWSAANGLAMVDVIRGAGFQSQHLLLALGAGEPYRVARAIAMEGGYLASEGAAAAKRATALFDLAAGLAERAGNPHAIALATLVRGNANYFCGEWKLSRERCEEAEANFRDRCTGVSWEIHTAQTFSLWSLLWLGEVREFGRRVATLIGEAEERGDLYALTAFRTARAQYGYPAADDVVTGRREVAAVMERWSRQGFQLPHWWELFANGNLDLYEGGDAAYRRIEARWRALASSMLLRIQVLRLEALHLRARGALAAAQALPGERSQLAHFVRSLAIKMTRERVPWSDALAVAIQATVSNLEGRPAEAIARLDEAIDRLGATDMPLIAACARRRKGQLIGGAEGNALIATADAFMTAQRIARPARMASMLMPGFPD
jgi:serine/threonine protein kinase